MTDSIEQRRAKFAMESAPIIDELRANGVDVATLDELRRLAVVPGGTVDILVKWLRQIEPYDVKEAIVRALSMPWVEATIAPTLIDEFVRTPSFTFRSDLRWTLGNAIACIADERVLEDVISLATNRSYGRDREMVVLALARMRDSRAIDTLIKLLNDDQVASHALEALRKCGKRAVGALDHVRALAAHGHNARVRSEARRTVRVLARAMSKMNSHAHRKQ